MKKNAIIDLTTGSVFQTLLAFSAPIMVSNLLQSAYNIVDMIIIGQYMGKIGLSAVSISTDILHLINLGCNGLCNAAQVMIAQYTGAKHEEQVSRTIGTLFTTFGIIAIAVMSLLLFLTNPILRFMNTDVTVWDEAVAYISICCLGQVFNFGYCLLGAFLRGKGDSKHPLLFVAIANVVNILLDLLFVAAFHMGAAGAALATVIGQTLSFLWGMYYLIRNRVWFGFDFSLKSFRPDIKLQKQFFKLGLPMCMQSVLVSVARIMVNSYVYSYGVTVTAISGVGNKLGSLAQIITNSLIRGGAAMVGQNIAAGKTDRVKQIVRYNFVLSMSYATLLSLITILFPKFIFGIFTTDSDVMAMIPAYLPVVIITYYTFASRSPTMALVNGIGRPKINMAMGLIDGLVSRPGLSLLMGLVLNMGLTGFWYGGALAGFTAFFIGGTYYLTGKWKHAKLITKE